ncbi:MAG: hypothetical protein DRO67_02755 [Candidatus Asgardarchaeum californiense]|nr:MAG: hypothetical protein DRO67_02755 [Candidatus Asgardarchaeum californiense]
MSPRPIKRRCIEFYPDTDIFSPLPKWRSSGTIELYVDELEALRLVDYQGLSQENAAQKMGISRGTVWRLLDSGRKKMIAMVVEHKEMIVV